VAVLDEQRLQVVDDFSITRQGAVTGIAFDAARGLMYLTWWIEGSDNLEAEAQEGAGAPVQQGLGIWLGEYSAAQALAVDSLTDTAFVADTIYGIISVPRALLRPFPPKLPPGQFTRLPGSTRPWAIAVDPNRGLVYTLNYEDERDFRGRTADLTDVTQSVSVMDEQTSTIVATLVLAGEPRGLALDPDQHLLFVTDRYVGTLTVIQGF
jgi:DNA-binding beta-propeller fold protein YncE